MSYTTEFARLLSHQLTKFATYRRYRLVGHVANLDFWLAEARHCLSGLDNYLTRHLRQKHAQTKYVLEHKVVEFDPSDPGSVLGPAAPPRRTSDAELADARRLLCEAIYRFLVRCFNKGFIEMATLRKECESFGIEINAADLKAR